MGTEDQDGRQERRWVAWVVFAAALVVTFGLGMLVVTIMERRWQTVRPQIVVEEIDEWETDSAVWGRSYPRQYETFQKTSRTDTRTAFGGAYPRDYLAEDPRQVILFAGYGFSRDYKQARGHWYAVEDIMETARTTRPDGTDTGMPGTCWTCKSPDVLELMDTRGVESFYAAGWLELADDIENPIGCLDCHDPETMDIRVSRPALRDAFARRGADIDEADHQQMRSLVCAQCHVEYYFANDPGENAAGAPRFAEKGTYLVFPWQEGTTAEDMIRYFEDRPEFHDWVHPISGTRMVKMQHPDWEVYRTGIHAYRDVSCADCHMPYRTEGGVKFTNHHVQSPLLDVASSCGVCHRWSEAEIIERVESTQKKHHAIEIKAEDAIVRAHFDVAACMEAGAPDRELAPLREDLWRAQLMWDYVSAHNGMGFHSPQECVRTLANAIDLAQRVRIGATRILVARGYTSPPSYPDVSTREKAFAVILEFERAAADPDVSPPSLLAPPEAR
jgi:nitrite reductase (cytochrome c-552)